MSNNLKQSIMNYWHSKTESEYYANLDLQESEKEIIKCPLCLEEVKELTRAGFETTGIAKSTKCCLECIDLAFEYKTILPNSFLTYCRSLKAHGMLSYENVIKSLK